MAAGLPVVATNVGGAAEAIVEGETGFLIDSDDDEALAAKLGELLADEAKARAFGAQGRMIVRERFSIGKQLSETLELYGI
ncbi:MAG: glycosyltransferase family 4 protein [Acidobacteria bacterium]|nr:glycosyltransferase family 4 protein [Acidobacteriota bacterium]